MYFQPCQWTTKISVTSLSFTSKEMLCEDNITFQDDKLKEHRESTLKYPGALLIIIHLEY